MLENINSPEDLKKINEEDLPVLCEEIRKYITKTILSNGGHLASSLGSVEITVALHRSFDAPKDKLIFDVGHQGYTHKILTGRYSKFKTIRKLNGLSGFLKREESTYDIFGAGHSSTSISAGLGIATARDIKKEDFYIIINIGDGAITGGMALEALNHAGQIKNKIIIVLNDNEMSISENTGAISNFLNFLSSKKTYKKFKYDISNKLVKSTVGMRFKKLASIIKRGIKYFLYKNGIFFEELGFKYLGPYNGHDILVLENGFKIAKNIDGPVLIHVITKKGKGNYEAEANPEKFHGVSFKEKEKKETFTEVFSKHLVKIARNNKRITAITAAMPLGTGLHLFKETFPKRFFDVSIAEQHGITFAAGQSIEGFHPVVAIYSTFIQRGVDQVIHDICIQKLPVTIVLDRAGLVGEDGETHHGIFDIALFGCIPNLIFMEPKNDLELEDMLSFSLEYNGPSMIRFPKSNIPKIKINKKNTPIKIGEMEFIIKNNSNICIISLGIEYLMAINIEKKLKAKKIDIDIINARFINSINKEWMSILNKYEFIFTIENHVKLGGFGSLIKSKLKNNINVTNYGLPNEFIRHGTIKELRNFVKFTESNILKDILRNLNEQ